MGVMSMASSTGRRDGWIEENTLTILDASGENDSRHIHDDRAAFLEAVRASSIVPEQGTRPTYYTREKAFYNDLCLLQGHSSKIYEAIFRILKDWKSLELIMGSYCLLNELEKRYPRVYASDLNNHDSSLNIDVVVVKESWLPFSLGLDGCSERGLTNSDAGGRIDFSGFNHLILKLAEVADGANSYTSETKASLQFLANMLLFQYLIGALEGDFLPRYRAYNETTNWTFLRESLLNVLVGSRRINFKGLIKDSLSILCCVHNQFFRDLMHLDDSSAKPCGNHEKSVEIALVEAGDSTSNAMQRFMVMIMELDIAKQKANLDGHTTRSDGVRTPLIEILIDEVAYSNDTLSAFLQAFNEPKWKLEIVLQYFSKYMAKPSCRTRRSTESMEDVTFDGVLTCFSNINSVKSIIKKIGPMVAQLLLAHAFQAYLLSPRFGVNEYIGESCSEISKKLISAFDCLRKTDEDFEILPLGKEALFTAATIISAKS